MIGNHLRLQVLIILLLTMLPTAYSQTPPALILPTEPGGSVQLDISAMTKLNPDQFEGYAYLSVFVQPAGEEHHPHAVQGRHRLEGNYLVFSPYFPFESGITYLVRTQQGETEGSYAYQAFQLEAKPRLEKAAVLRMYPSARELPENLLRFYFYFNTPMKKGQALAHIHLTDAAGKVDTQAFMEFKQELWSPDGKRLTLLFDPGRIKRGVSTNLALGPALLEGQQYQLTISATWQDVYGQALSVETRKAFVIGQAYRQAIKIDAWQIEKPALHSHDPLGIHFDRIMDHALLQSMIQLEDADQNPIPGHWEVLEEEQQIQFIPQQTWQKGNYRIVLDSRLEDVAGNNLQNLLDQKDATEAGKGEAHQVIGFEL
ncbi:MAG: hypothetical protein AAFR61_25720 [Bacteroidota bacterium]